jgi:cytochrome P450
MPSPTPTDSCSTAQTDKHVALGHGLRYCLGVPLARLESRIALQTVCERWPTIRQAGELVYADNFNVRMLRSLPVPHPERDSAQR